MNKVNELLALPENKDNDYWDILVKYIVDNGGKEGKKILDVLITVANELDSFDIVIEIMEKMINKNYYPEICEYYPEIFTPNLEDKSK